MSWFQYACGVLAAMAWVWVASGAAYPDCDPAQAYHLGNGHCHEGFNNEPCGYDGGDCCECTCQDSDLFECGAEGYHCLDPDAPCQNDFMFEEVLNFRKLGEMVTFGPTSSPTPTPSTATDDSDSVRIHSTDDDVSGSSDDGSSSQDTEIIIVGCVIGALLIIGSVIFIRKRRGLARDTTDSYYPLAEGSSLERTTDSSAAVESREIDDRLLGSGENSQSGI